MPARTRTANLTAAQWSPNGGSIGQSDLTQPGANVFGENVFSPAVQRQRLPKAIYKQLQRDDRGRRGARHRARRRRRERDEGMGDRARRHALHALVPADDRADGGEARLVRQRRPATGSAIAEFSGKELIKGEPDASSFPSGGIRATFEARGYTAWDPTSPAFILENAERRATLSSRRRSLVDRRGARHEDAAAALDATRCRRAGRARAAAVRRRRPARVFTTVGPEQEYFLIDEELLLSMRPDLITTGRTLFGAKPPKGQELEDHYFGAIPERVLAFMMDVERELWEARRADQDAPQRGRAGAVRAGADLRARRTSRPTTTCCTMEVLQKVARRHGLVCLLHEKPFAGINGSGKHNNWSLGTDTGENLLEPGEHAARQPAVPVLLSAVHPRGRPAPGPAARVGRPRRATTTAWARTRRRRRSSRSSSATSWRTIFERDRDRLGRRGDAAELTLELGVRRCRRCRRTRGDRNRTSPFAFTGNKFEFRAVGLLAVDRAAEHGAQHDRRRVARRAGRGDREQRATGESLEAAVLDVVRATWSAHKRIVFNGDNYAEEWHAEAERRGPR